VRDSSEKPATGVACEDLQRIARPRSEAQGTRPKIKNHIHQITVIQLLLQFLPINQGE